MSEGARDPFVAAREMALAISEFAPAVPTIELAIEHPPHGPLARFRLGQVPSEGWVPSIALVGRRAVGKSSLSVSLADFASTGQELAVSCVQASWGGTLLAYDTPGLRSAGRPRVRSQLREALAPDPPDVMVAVFSATEVDAGIDDDLDDLVDLSRAWTPRRARPPAIIAALHRVDELPPFDRDLTSDDPERSRSIATATRVLRAHLSPLDGRCPIVATSTIGGGLDATGVRSLAVHAGSLLAQRLGTPGDRSAAFDRCLGAQRPADDPSALEALARLRRRWAALDDEARSILLHPRGWQTATGGRSERG